MTERVVELDLGVVPEAAVSGARLLQTDRVTILTFNAMHRRDGAYDPAGTAVIELHRCLLTKFGLPNDEALRGHPLVGRGLGYYGCFEVLDSDWRAEAESRNRVAFPSTDYRNLRHLVFTFHDDTFECLAEGLTLRIVRSGGLGAEFDALVDRLRRG